MHLRHLFCDFGSVSDQSKTLTVHLNATGTSSYSKTQKAVEFG